MRLDGGDTYWLLYHGGNGFLPDFFIQSVGVSAVREDEKTRSRIGREKVQKK